MTTEHKYTPDSWQSVTTQVKEALGISLLTKKQASAMLRLYITGMCAEDIIKEMKGEEIGTE